MEVLIWSGRDGLVSVETRKEILHQTAELRRKQDARLAAHQQRSAVLAGGFLTIGALVTALLASPAVEASSSQVRTAGAIALMIAVANGLCWAAVHSGPVQWYEGPRIDQLVCAFVDRRHNGYSALLDTLIQTISYHYDRNERVVRRVRLWVGFQSAMTLVATCILIGAVLKVG